MVIQRCEGMKCHWTRYFKLGKRVDFFAMYFTAKRKKKSFYSIECYFPAFPPMERGLQIQSPHKKIPITPMRGLGPGGGRWSVSAWLNNLSEEMPRFAWTEGAGSPRVFGSSSLPGFGSRAKRFEWAPLSKLAFWARSWLKSEAQVTSEAHISPRLLPVLSRLSILIAVQHFTLTRKFLKIHLS